MSTSLVDSSIKQLVPGLSFIDVGGLWNTVNEKVTVALAAGAASATMFDIQPIKNLCWTKFDERAEAAGFGGKYDSISGNLDDPKLIDRIGQFDFVYCSGIIYHAPSPVHTLLQLKALTKKYLYLGSMTVQRIISNLAGEIILDEGEVIFIPALSGKKLAIVQKYFNDLNLEVHNITSVKRYPWMINGLNPNYAPWWWLWTSDTLSKMLEVVGFKVIDVIESWHQRSHHLICELI